MHDFNAAIRIMTVITPDKRTAGYFEYGTHMNSGLLYIYGLKSTYSRRIDDKLLNWRNVLH